MKTKLLMSTAAFAASAFFYPAIADSIGSAGKPAGPQAMQLAQMDKGGGSPGSSSGGSMGGGNATGGAQGQGSAPEGSQKTGDTPRANSKSGEQEKSPAAKGAEKGERSQDRAQGEAKDKKDMKRSGDKDRDRDMKRGDRDKDSRSSDRREGKDSKASDRGDRKDGKSADRNDSKSSGKNVSINSSQRTRIKTVIRSQKVERLSKVNFSVRVGARIPQSVHWYPVPVEIVDIVPEYRDYYYVVVGDDILIIDPGSREIVAVIRLA